jgi:hypothetical protein
MDLFETALKIGKKKNGRDVKILQYLYYVHVAHQNLHNIMYMLQIKKYIKLCTC